MIPGESSRAFTCPSYSFARSRGDVIEQLTDHALVKHSSDLKNFSLHRLVQAEALFRMTENERQEAFKGAVKLIYDKSLTREHVVSSGHLRQEGDQYLPHVNSLARNWKNSQDKPEPLHPIADFFNLMAYCAR